MPRRAVESVLSVLVAALAAWLARESEALRGLELWVAAIAAGLTILIINLRRAISADDASNSVTPSRPGPGPVRASSSTVSIVPLLSVQKVANFRNRKFQRFESGAEPLLDWSPRSRTSNPGSVSPEEISQGLGYG